jgi:hypothetical protein
MELAPTPNARMASTGVARPEADDRSGEYSERWAAGSRIPQLVAALIIREAIPHRLFGRTTLCVGLAEIVAALGASFSLIFPSLMMGIDQSIVSEH